MNILIPKDQKATNSLIKPQKILISFSSPRKNLKHKAFDWIPDSIFNYKATGKRELKMYLNQGILCIVYIGSSMAQC